MGFENGNKADGKHYWLTPPDLFEELDEEFGFDFDPCPFPKPEDFNGLHAEWGECSYVNPPFGSYLDTASGKRKGPTAWARKCLMEFDKGKKVVMVYPVDKWVLMMIEAGAEIRNLKDVRWHATEDGTPKKPRKVKNQLQLFDDPRRHSKADTDEITQRPAKRSEYGKAKRTTE